MESEINSIFKSLDTKRTVFLHAEGPLFCFGVNVCKKTACFFGGGEICLTLRHLTIILTYA